MLHSIEEETDELIDFSQFSKLSHTAEDANEESGKILYIPSSIPIPHSKQILNAMFGTEEAQVLAMPLSMEELRDNIYFSIEFLLKSNGEGVIIFFCEPTFIDKVDSIAGSEFIDLKELTISDSKLVMKNIYESIVPHDIPLADIGDFPELILRIHLQLADIEAGGETLKPTSARDDFYLPYSAFEEASESLREYFLSHIGIEDVDLFRSLNSQAQKELYAQRVFETYGFIEDERYMEEVQLMSNARPEVQTVLQKIAVEYLLGGERNPMSRVDSIVPDGVGRSIVSETQDLYQELTGKENLQVPNPRAAGRELQSYLPLIFIGANKDRIYHFSDEARTHFQSECEKMDDYSIAKQREVLDRYQQFLDKMAEIGLITSIHVISEALSQEEWKPVHRNIIETAHTHDFNINRGSYIPGIVESRQEYARDKEESELAEEIRNIRPTLENVPQFLDIWTDFLIKDSDASSASTLPALIEKFDEFSTTVVEEYDDIVANSNQHISGLLDGPDDETIRIYVIIDGLGYTDSLLMEKLGYLKVEVESSRPLYSNIPSYTPSAMSTLLTGLPADTTGIYHWTVRKGDDAINLKHRVDEDLFTNIDTIGSREFQLVQHGQYSQSGITRFARAAHPNVKLEPELTFSNIQGAEEEFIESFREIMRERQERIERIDGGLVPEDQAEQALESLQSTFVFYLESFDQYIHKELASYEFEPYYITMAGFINRIIEGFQDVADSFDVEVEIIAAGDHGKLTRREINLINQEQSYSFSDRIISDEEIFDFHQMAYIDVDKLTRLGPTALNEHLDTEDRIPIRIVSDIDELSSEEIKVKLRNAAHLDPDFGIDLEEDDLLRIVETGQFTLSGAKFLFGYTDENIRWLKNQVGDLPGIDLVTPSAGGYFESPEIGFLSRYATKNISPRHHGYHGGTSLSEMVSVELVFR